MRAAASRTFWTAGSKRPMRMAMVAMTTSNSISVKAERRITDDMKHLGSRDSFAFALRRNVEVDGVAAGADLLDDRALLVVLGGKRLHAHGRHRPGRARRVRDFFVGHLERPQLDAVLADHSPVPAGDVILALLDDPAGAGAGRPLGRDELDRALLDRLAIEVDRTGH